MLIPAFSDEDLKVFRDGKRGASHHPYDVLFPFLQAWVAVIAVRACDRDRCRERKLSGLGLAGAAPDVGDAKRSLPFLRQCAEIGSCGMGPRKRSEICGPDLLVEEEIIFRGVSVESPIRETWSWAIDMGSNSYGRPFWGVPRQGA